LAKAAADFEVAEDGADVPDGFVVLKPGREHLGERLDKYVATLLPDLSRVVVQGLIEEGHVLVDGVTRKSKFKVTPGETVSVVLPDPVEDEIEPDPIPLDVVFEDDDVIVVDKPAGMVVHPAPGHPRGTLANALIAHDPGIAVAGSHRPGIVHRLDKDTSGLIVAAKTDRGRNALISQWGTGEVEKRYLALVAGVVEDDEATIDAPIGRDPKNRQRMAVVRNGREAVSHFRVIERFPHATLLEVAIETGRTHQIRVHLAFIGHPVIGDPVYGRPLEELPRLNRQFLHASELAFSPPDGTRLSLQSPLPDDLDEALGALRRAEASSAESR
jgi:23S rRNA pseudouridine1911/1915/1917 synthase